MISTVGVCWCKGVAVVPRHRDGHSHYSASRYITLPQSVMGNSYGMPAASVDLGGNKGVHFAKNQLFELQIA